MKEFFLADPTPDCRDLHLVAKPELDAWREGLGESDRMWVESHLTSPKPGDVLPLPADPDGRARHLAVTGGAEPFWAMAQMPRALPPGEYRLAAPPGNPDAAALAWVVGQYAYERYRSAATRQASRLVWPAGADRDRVLREAEADALTRDLVNTPAEDMGPAELAAAAADLAARYSAGFTVIEGDDLLEQGFPAIHAVGRASSRAPRLIDLTWGDAKAPKLTLVGKGVCFDSGGLNIKPAAGMRHMKKDMGGAAHVLGLAGLVMAAGLPVRLRVLVSAVENSISGQAYRPGDIVPTRAGLHVEIGNTDAEGRIVLSDALTYAAEEEPDLIVDMATLTGAARVALGPDLPAVYGAPAELAREVEGAGLALGDPLWSMPLWTPYAEDLRSPVADLNNIPQGAFAGSIFGALFLKRFVPAGQDWLHVDLFAWNPRTRPGRTEGAAAQGLRAFAAWLGARYTR